MLLGRAGSVLEVGSYIGAFLSAARAAGWQGVGLDVNAQASGYARTHGCTIEETTLDDYQTGTRFDAVALWNCFDQMADPHETLRRASSLLRPDGVLAVRGQGLWAGVDIDPALMSGRAASEKLMARGVLAKDTHGSTIRLAPPLVVTPEEVDLAVESFATVLR